MKYDEAINRLLDLIESLRDRLKQVTEIQSLQTEAIKMLRQRIEELESKTRSKSISS